MRRIIGILLAVLSAAILVMAMNQSFINKVKQEKYFDHLRPEQKHSFLSEWLWKSDRWRYGDLYGLCFLPKYKIKLEPFREYSSIRKSEPTNRILYIIGDSFLADKVLDGAFDKFDQVIFLDRRFPSDYIRIDSAKQNYLILELAERNLIHYNIARENEKKWSIDEIKTGHLTRELLEKNELIKTSIADRLNKILFNKDLSRNIELLLFDNKLSSVFKEQKAKLDYALFNKVEKEVAVSSDKKRLLLNSTVDTSSVESSFSTIDDKTVSEIANLLNVDYNYYKAIGFKNVFLSIIPNAVTIYDQKRMHYNNLLERTEEKIKFPKISILNNFLKEKENLFYLSDSHWNPKGLDRWVEETNKVLNTNIP